MVIICRVCALCLFCFLFFFFNDTATTEIYTLSLHDALPISRDAGSGRRDRARQDRRENPDRVHPRSEEHTSELQSQSNLVCRLLLEKKKKTQPQFQRPSYTAQSTSP